ncbi:hypothetical protein CCR85_01595 [Rhodothalassium salexigens]|uniref:ABC transporter transmembrane domain-containing protein n=1 Tax=Rhodothalassium salexigens TaxID=1086 RepID=UPI001912E068|nr:ABC transporter transmembrane domain-containing protein [Rhodothalassium salexigens]MBK5910186.1 hypothetical protein [Rhodothalassium salexigens]
MSQDIDSTTAPLTAKSVPMGPKTGIGTTPPHAFSFSELWYYFRLILGPEARYFWMAVVFGVAISVLTLAVPISVQMVIDTIANTALVQPLIVLSLALFGLLALSALLMALRTHLLEIYGRRAYARLVSEFSLQAIYAQAPFFEEVKRDGLFHRYFDIMTLQRSLPEILIGGFSIILQAVIGFAVVSLYHPVFLAFNLVLILLLFLVWQIWGPGAIRTGIDLSHAKYETAKWLSHLGETNGFYKSDHHIGFALQRSEELTANYIKKKKAHFRRNFAQTIGLLFLYATASAALLALGGWLVIRGQLSLGQLVAAELIMSAIFVGMSQFDSYLKRFYYVCMAIDEIGLVYKIPLENTAGRLLLDDKVCDLRFDQVAKTVRRREAVLDIVIPGGVKVLARAEDDALQRLFTNLLKRHELPDRGWITLAGYDLMECDVHRLRQEVVVIDRPMVADCSIEEYLSLAASAEATRGQMFDVLRMVGIDDIVKSFDKGLDTVMSPLGLPLSPEETMRLQLAAALLADPHILVLNESCDVIEQAVLERVLDHIVAERDMTVVFFSNHHSLPQLDHRLWLGWDRQRLSLVDPSAAAGAEAVTGVQAE